MCDSRNNSNMTNAPEKTIEYQLFDARLDRSYFIKIQFLQGFPFLFKDSLHYD